MDLKKLQVKLATHYYQEAIDGIYEASLQTKATIGKDLDKQAQEIISDTNLGQEEKDYLLNTLGDDFFIAEMTTELAGEMMIVALYKTIEISIKKMTQASGLFTPRQLESFFQISKLKQHLKNKICDIETLKSYKAYDELRCINNSIKHTGIVGDALAKYPSFKKGEKLKNLHEHYYRLRNDADKFLMELQEQILAAMP